MDKKMGKNFAYAIGASQMGFLVAGGALRGALD